MFTPFEVLEVLLAWYRKVVGWFLWHDSVPRMKFTPFPRSSDWLHLMPPRQWFWHRIKMPLVSSCESRQSAQQRAFVEFEVLELQWWQRVFWNSSFRLGFSTWWRCLTQCLDRWAYPIFATRKVVETCCLWQLVVCAWDAHWEIGQKPMGSGALWL